MSADDPGDDQAAFRSGWNVLGLLALVLGLAVVAGLWSHALYELFLWGWHLID